MTGNLFDQEAELGEGTEAEIIPEETVVELQEAAAEEEADSEDDEDGEEWQGATLDHSSGEY